jgi:ribosomal protein S4E
MIGGRHVGQVSSVVKFESAKNPEPVVVTLSDGYNTIKDNLFIVGNKSPEISLLEGVIA